MSTILPAITALEFDTGAAAAHNAANQGASFLFDFAAGDFVLVDGKLVPITDKAAVKVWVEKCLRTEKHQYAIYARDDDNEYGVSIEDLIGSVFPRAFIESELKREITEAVTRHPRISSISNLSAVRDGANMMISFTLNLTDGQTEEVTISG